MSNRIIAIGRQFGSGGKEVGIRVAKELGIPFYDRELLQEAAKKSGLCEKIFENFDEAVCKYIREQGGLEISLLDAKAIKEGVGAVWEGRNANPVTIQGTLALTENKIQMSISTEDILGVFSDPLYNLIN